MNINSNNELLNSLVFTDAINLIEQKIYNKNETTLNSYIKSADNTLDNIFIYNQLFNPDYSLRVLYNNSLKKFKNQKRKKKQLNSFKSFNDIWNKTVKTIINPKKVKFQNMQRNKSNISNIKIKFIRNDNYKEKRKNNLNIDFHTINNFYNRKNEKPIKRNEVNGTEFNKNDELFYNPNGNNISIQKKDEEKIINELKINKKKLLQFYINQNIKEMKKKKKLKHIEKDIENKTNSLFYKNKFKNNIEANIIPNLDIKDIKENNVQNPKKGEINMKNIKFLKENKNQSLEKFSKLTNLNHIIYRNCLQNIKLDKNFPGIVNYVNKQRLSQYYINHINRKMKAKEENKKLLRNQSKEINFHKKELIKTEEKEKLYNMFKKQIKERFIHKNLSIDAISKISTKLAYYGRKYFIKSYNYHYANDKDFLFENEIQNLISPKKNKKLKKAQSSYDEAISNMDKISKYKNEIIKRIEKDEEKYNNIKNGYFFSLDNKDTNKKPIFN